MAFYDIHDNMDTRREEMLKCTFAYGAGALAGGF